MNEYFGKNVRKLRKNKNLTQEQFAQALGVSFQSVSRWENCVTYPDVELIPLIARYFGVTIDELFGIPEENKKAVFKAMMKELTELGEDDTERAIEILRTVRAGYDLNETFGDLCYKLTYSHAKKTPALTDELRRMSEAFFDGNPEAYQRTWALENFVQLEEEQYIPALLERHASSDETTINSLLYERYLYRDEFDKAEVYRQRKLYTLIDKLINGRADSWRDWRAPKDVNSSLWRNNLLLDFLHGLNKETPTDEHPITCGKGPDIFLEQRVFLGELRTCYLAMLGRTEEAYRTLEDVVSLMEQAFALPDGAMLKSSTPALSTLEFKIDNRKTELYYTFNDDHGLHDRWGLHPKIDYDLLTSEPSWAWLDSIRGDERFKALAERVKNLI